MAITGDCWTIKDKYGRNPGLGHGLWGCGGARVFWGVEGKPTLRSVPSNSATCSRFPLSKNVKHELVEQHVSLCFMDLNKRGKLTCGKPDSSCVAS